ncbi:MAG: hypothetical protein JRN52_01330 [Nitrososphaerota archaeon]|nr:hypothetical protein [Nitrososphaerota archaeon]
MIPHMHSGFSPSSEKQFSPNVPSKLAGQSSVRKVRMICRSCGHGGCGVYVTVKDGRAVSVEPDKEHPVSNGYIC